MNLKWCTQKMKTAINVHAAYKEETAIYYTCKGKKQCFTCVLLTEEEFQRQDFFIQFAASEDVKRGYDR